MHLFIKKVSLFAFCFAISYVVVLTCILSINRLRTGNCSIGNTRTIIAGDSHTMWAIDDSKLNGVQNISLNAEGYIYTYAKLRYLLKQKHNIQKLYLGFSYHNLSGYYDEYIYGNMSLYFINRYIGVLNLTDYLRLFRSSPKYCIKMSQTLLREGLWQLFESRCAFLGTFPSEVMKQTLDSEKMKKRIKEQYYQNGTVFPYSYMNIEYLNKILYLCKKNGIEVIALATPLQKEYHRLIPDQYINAYDQFIKSNNLGVYNFKGLELPDSCYLPDGDHVNYHGAMAITDYFRTYLTMEKMQ